MRARADLTHPAYRPDIDGLRAVAVAAVVGFHAFPGAVPGGYVGVDVFFVISGYLISTILFGSLRRDTFGFLAFYVRRIRRIFPVLLLVLVASLAVGWWELLPDEYGQLGKHVAGGAGFVANLVYWSESGYFDNAAVTKPLLHLWSLGIEEQFYLAWPALLWLAWRWRLNLVAVVLALALLSFALNVALTAHDASAAFYAPQTRFWELMLGALLAQGARTPAANARPRPAAALAALVARLPARWPGNFLAWLGCCLIFGSLALISVRSPFPGWWALLPTVGALAIIGAGPDSWFNRVVLSQPPVVGLGLISYPLYLWHWPLLSFAHIIEGQAASIPVRIAAVAVALVLAALSYFLVEIPLQRSSRGRRVAAALALAMLVVGLLGVAVHARRGIGTRFAAGAAFDWPQARNRNAACPVQLQDLQYCVAAGPPNVTAALIGDSHANMFVGFIAQRTALRGGGTLMLGSPGCPPLLGVERDGSCAAEMARIVAQVNADPGIRDVFIAGRFAATLSGNQFGADTPPDWYHLTLAADPSVTDRRAIFAAGFENLIRALQGRGRRIAVVLDVPELSFDPRSCLAFRRNDGCTMARTVVDSRQRAYTHILLDLQRRYGFDLIDPKSALCDARACIAKDQDRILYRDFHHLGEYGVDFLIASPLSLY